jgi:N-acetylglucosaminyldiphosphoundecaprenol N-acetyl-beta-D-mannosaminyltransferase
MMTTEFDTVSVLGYTVFSDNLLKIPIQGEKCRVINCSISPNNYALATKDAEFKTVLQKTDYLVLDGVYFALASIFLLGKNIKKNQGPDVYKHFITRLDETSGKAFFLGSSETVLQKIKDRIGQEYPRVSVGTFSPPFKSQFSAEDNAAMVSKINDFKPDIVFVGMTAPKQEKWALQNRDQLNSNLVISIGNVFDWYAGTQKAIHPFWFKIRLGWLVRIFLRPEVFRRNIGNQMLFFWHLLLIMLRIKKNPKND